MSIEPASLSQLFHLQQLSEDLFQGVPSNEPHIRAFGGQIAAQSLAAGALTVKDDLLVNSLHAYFLRAGDPQIPTLFKVKKLRDGRSFSTREVEAIQDNKVIFTMTASFHVSENGIEHTAEPMPQVPQPETLAPFQERFAGRNDLSDMARWFIRAKPFDIRYVDKTPFDITASTADGTQQVWFRAIEPLPDLPAVHQCVATYASDMTVLDAILLRHGMRWTDRKILGASLDHAIWFHQPFDADEWLLFNQDAPIAYGARGTARAQVWTIDGRLVMSVMQEALLRPPRTPAEAP